MPRPQRAMGRPGTKVIPDDWSATHAAVVDRTHPSTITIGSAGTAAAWDATAGTTRSTAAAAAYAGPATVMQASADQAATVVEDQLSTAVYQVSLPYAASGTVAIEMVLTVVSDPDPMLVGKTMRVASIERGSRRFSRVLLAVLIN